MSSYNSGPQRVAAKGGMSIRDQPKNIVTQMSAKDLPSHNILKLRQPGQNTEDEIRRRNLKEELKRAESEYKRDKKVDEEALLLLEQARELDKDDSDESEDDDEEEDESDDEESDTEELLRELEKIKKERAEEQARKEKEQYEKEQREREEQALSGNPLLLNQEASKIKRRWDDDVVFKNQTAGVDNKPKKRFINDLLRSDFHKKFMNKYIK